MTAIVIVFTVLALVVWMFWGTLSAALEPKTYIMWSKDRDKAFLFAVVGIVVVGNYYVDGRWVTSFQGTLFEAANQTKTWGLVHLMYEVEHTDNPSKIVYKGAKP